MVRVKLLITIMFFSFSWLIAGTAANPTPLKNGEVVHFDGNKVKQYYSFILSRPDKVVMSFDVYIDGSLWHLVIYDENFNIVKELKQVTSVVLELNKGKYILFLDVSKKGNFSIFSPSLADSMVDETGVENASSNTANSSSFFIEHSDVDQIRQLVQNRQLEINGYYVHYGDGAFDWIYISSDKNYVAKLEKGITEDGNLIWTFIHTPSNRYFKQIFIDGKNIVLSTK